jgi:hypothetical protein
MVSIQIGWQNRVPHRAYALLHRSVLRENLAPVVSQNSYFGKSGYQSKLAQAVRAFFRKRVGVIGNRLQITSFFSSKL